MYNFNWVDYTILAIFFLSTLMGFWRGLVREMLALITLVAAFVLATMLASPLATAFTNYHSVQGIVNQASTSAGVSAAQPASYIMLGIAFILIFVGVLIVGAIISFVINLAFRSGFLGIGNRLLGAVFGVCRGFLINLVIIFMVQFSALSTEQAWQQSQLVSYFLPSVHWLNQMVSPNLATLKEKFGASMGNISNSVTNSVSGAVSNMRK